ncbi:glycosyltransferase family 32 protein [Colwelliaceae bacterium 6471]
MVIPKIIHYCWFGQNDKPQDVQAYIDGWQRMLPDYQIIEWNEDNFDIHINPYVEQAYQAKKFAFVSDYARLLALYTQGGIYLDTDVEVLKPFDDLLDNDVVLGFEEKGYVATSTICARKNSLLINAFMSLYHHKHFIQPNGQYDLTTNVTKMTTLLQSYGLVLNEQPQQLTIDDKETVTILAQVKFSPYDYLNQINYADDSTYTIHHFGATWAGPQFKYIKVIKSAVIKLLGSKNYQKLYRFITRSKT